MIDSEIINELMKFIDEDASRLHSRSGPVSKSLVRVLERYEELRTPIRKGVKRQSNGDIWANPNEENPDDRFIVRQVGWLGHSGVFYSMASDPALAERGGWSPVYIQISQS